MSWLKEYIVDQVRYQLMNLSSVKIQHKYNDRTKKFYIDSRAGLITYKTKSDSDTARFRDKWINKIEMIRQRELDGKDVMLELCVIYEHIIQEEKVSYEATLNTRMRRKWNSIKSNCKIF